MPPTFREVQVCGREGQIMHKSTYKLHTHHPPLVKREEKAPSLNTKQLHINEPFLCGLSCLTERGGREEARERGEREGLHFSLGSDSHSPERSPQSSDARHGALGRDRVGGRHHRGAIVGRVALPQRFEVGRLHGLVVLQHFHGIFYFKPFPLPSNVD